MSANNEEDRTRSSLAVLGCALAYYMAGSPAINDDSAAFHAFAWYWLPNSLFLAALLLLPSRRWLPLAVVSLAHVVPLLSLNSSADQIVCSLICNEGLVLCAVAVVRLLLDEQAPSRSQLSVDTAYVTHAVGCSYHWAR